MSLLKKTDRLLVSLTRHTLIFNHGALVLETRARRETIDNPMYPAKMCSLGIGIEIIKATPTVRAGNG